MKRIYLLCLFIIGACCNGNICAQTSIPDTLLFVFKLHGQTRKYEMSFRKQSDTLRIDQRICAEGIFSITRGASPSALLQQPGAGGGEVCHTGRRSR